MHSHALSAPAPEAGPPPPPNPPRPHPHVPFEWRHWKKLDILPDSAVEARHLVTRLLAGHGFPAGMTQDAEQVTAELVANALASAARGQQRGIPPVMVIAVSGVGWEVCLSVYDSDPTPPPPGWTAAEEDEHGRGLTILGALSDDWGWTPGDLAGKYVWSLMRPGARCAGSGLPRRATPGAAAAAGQAMPPGRGRRGRTAGASSGASCATRR
jgi:anti-sigma regulatory factor (Ser/Thr protein kinase)